MSSDDLRSSIENAAPAYEAEVARLAGLPGKDYDHERRAAAERLKVKLGTLDRDVKEARKKAEQAKRAKANSQRGGNGYDRPCPYEMNEGGTIWKKRTRDGETPVPLANFSATILADVQRDDGSNERTRHFRMNARIAGRVIPEFQITAAEFSAMGWVARELGARAIVEPGQNNAQHLRAAIQKLSPNPAERVIYTHTGWRRIGGRFCYLHADGAIDANGVAEGIETDLDAAALGSYALPPPPEGEELAEAVRCHLDLFQLGPIAVMAPLLCAIWRAPISTADFSVFLAGNTGTFKSELSAIAQQHFGAAMNARNLPGNWTSTPNSLEAKAFAAKDALFTIDDFAPSSSTKQVENLHMAAERMFRGQGNNAGRSRGRADGTFSEGKAPRGLILSSGEDVPKGESIRARLVIAEVSHEDVNVDILKNAKKTAAQGAYAAFVAGYVRWLAGRLEDVRKRLHDERDARRDELHHELSQSGSHRRTGSAISEMMAAAMIALDFAKDCGAISEEGRKAFERDIWNGLKALVRAQGESQHDESQPHRFLELVSSALSSGSCHLADKDTLDAPKGYERSLGWEAVKVGQHLDFRAKGDLIGWKAGDIIHLETNAAFRAAQSLGNPQHRPITATARTLWKRMDEAGLILYRTGDKNTYRLRVGNSLKSVVSVSAEHILGDCSLKKSEQKVLGGTGARQQEIDNNDEFDLVHDVHFVHPNSPPYTPHITHEKKKEIERQILLDVREAFATRNNPEKLPSEDLCSILNGMTARTWKVPGGWLNQTSLAKVLASVGLRPVQLWVSGKNLRGYQRADVEFQLERMEAGGAGEDGEAED